MITLKLTQYSYTELRILETAFKKALHSMDCDEYLCEMCVNDIPCKDVSNALDYIGRKIKTFESAEPDPPSDCF